MLRRAGGGRWLKAHENAVIFVRAANAAVWTFESALLESGLLGTGISSFWNAGAVRAIARLSRAMAGSSMRSTVGGRTHVLKSAEHLAEIVGVRKPAGIGDLFQWHARGK